MIVRTGVDPDYVEVHRQDEEQLHQHSRCTNEEAQLQLCQLLTAEDDGRTNYGEAKDQQHRPNGGKHRTFVAKTITVVCVGHTNGDDDLDSSKELSKVIESVIYTQFPNQR